MLTLPHTYRQVVVTVSKLIFINSQQLKLIFEFGIIKLAKWTGLLCTATERSLEFSSSGKFE